MHTYLQRKLFSSRGTSTKVRARFRVLMIILPCSTNRVHQSAVGIQTWHSSRQCRARAARPSLPSRDLRRSDSPQPIIPCGCARPRSYHSVSRAQAQRARAHGWVLCRPSAPSRGCAAASASRGCSCAACRLWAASPLSSLPESFARRGSCKCTGSTRGRW